MFVFGVCMFGVLLGCWLLAGIIGQERARRRAELYQRYEAEVTAYAQRMRRRYVR